MSTPVNTPNQELIVRLDPEYGYCVYEGTRAQLEAEGLIPEGMQWPKGYTKRHWSSGVFNFSLSRKRAPGSKGHQREGDWWSLRWGHRNPFHFGTVRIQLRMKELERMTRLYSPEGDIEWRRECSRYRDACQDQGFQAFKSLVPGLVQPPRGRRKAAAARSVTHERGQS